MCFTHCDYGCCLICCICLAKLLTKVAAYVPRAAHRLGRARGGADIDEALRECWSRFGR
jgi:hypothetical protein